MRAGSSPKILRSRRWIPRTIDVVAEIKNRTNGAGVDPAIETAAQPETVTMALQATRTLGRVVEVGIFERPATFELNDLVFQERELIGIIHRQRRTSQAIQMMADGRVVHGPMISSRIHWKMSSRRASKNVSLNKRANVKVIVRLQRGPA